MSVSACIVNLNTCLLLKINLKIKAGVGGNITVFSLCDTGLSNYTFFEHFTRKTMVLAVIYQYNS